MRRFGKQRGQGATETMLVTAVVVIAIVSSAYAFIPSFSSGVQILGGDVQQILETGSVAGLRSPLDATPNVDGGVTPHYSRSDETEPWIQQLMAWWGWE